MTVTHTYTFEWPLKQRSVKFQIIVVRQRYTTPWTACYRDVEKGHFVVYTIAPRGGRLMYAVTWSPSSHLHTTTEAQPTLPYYALNQINLAVIRSKTNMKRYLSSAPAVVDCSSRNTIVNNLKTLTKNAMERMKQLDNPSLTQITCCYILTITNNTVL